MTKHTPVKPRPTDPWVLCGDDQGLWVLCHRSDAGVLTRVGTPTELDAAKQQRDTLLEAARAALEDHRERVTLYGEAELQPNRARVMEQLHEAIRKAESGA